MGQAMQVFSVPCWWVGWWLWRVGCISQDTYLLYWVWSIKRKKEIALKDKFAHCTIQRFAGWRCAAKLLQQIKTFPEIRRWHRIGHFVGFNTTSCQICLYFSPFPLLCFLSLSDFFLFRCSWKNFGVFSVPLFLWFLSFCVFYPCRYSCESCGLFSIPLFLSVSYLFVLLFLADVPAKVLACFLPLSFFVFLIFLCFSSLQLFLWEFWRIFCPFLCLCFLSFCASIPCRCSCESWACFPSLSLSVFLIFLCFYSLQMFLREFGVFSVPLFLCVSCHNQPSHSPIVLPPTCQPRQISGKKSFQQKSLAHFSPWETASVIRPALKWCKHSVGSITWICSGSHFAFWIWIWYKKRKSIEQKNFQLLRQYCLLFYCLANFSRPYTFLTIPVQFLCVKYNVCPITKIQWKFKGKRGGEKQYHKY